MDVNGEAIYGTRPIYPYKEGKVCLTEKKDGKTLYAIYLADEDEKAIPSKISVSTIELPRTARVRLLGTSENLKWEKVGKGFLIDVPEKLQKKPPCEHAFAFEISF